MTDEPRTIQQMHARREAARARIEASARAFAERDSVSTIASPALPDPDPEPEPPPISPITLRGNISPQFIIAQVAAAARLTPDDLIGPDRSLPVVLARHAAFAILRAVRPDLSLPAIGRLFGGRDHTTVLNGVRKSHTRAGEPYDEAVSP